MIEIMRESAAQGGESPARPPASLEDRVMSAVNPPDLARPGEDHPEELWDLYGRSGYFALSERRPEEFEDMKSAFLNIVRKAPSVPRLIYHASSRSAEVVEGAMWAVKPYERTWMFHQLAKASGHGTRLNGRQVLRDVYTRCSEHVLADPGAQWVIAYVDAGVHWHERSLFRFTRAHEATGRTLILPFRLIGVDVPPVPDGPREDVGPIGPGELERLLGLLARTLPSAYVEALDLVPERITLAGSARSWRSSGLAREREILVARRGGEPVAAAILELGELGTNLFRLLDSVRIIPMREGGETASRALLAAAREWFRRRERSSFVHFRADGVTDGVTDEVTDGVTAEVTCAAGLRDMGPGVMWIIATELLPAWVRHIRMLTEPRPARP